MVKIAPSVLAADFARLGEQVRAVENAGVDRIQIDVMDGHFVPNLSMGPAVVESLRRVTNLTLEVHLMVDHPKMFVEPFAKAGADTIIVHYEVPERPHKALAQIRRLGKKAGLALKPETPERTAEPFLPDIGLLLCMTVHPGFGGQQFLADSPARIRRFRELIDRVAPACELEVDGGIDHSTAELAIAAGATVLVAGTAIFHFPGGPAAATRLLGDLGVKPARANS